MAKDKFNPIAELPILPGAEIANDERESNVIDATYPAIDTPNIDAKKTLIEIRLRETEAEELLAEKEKSEHLAVVRTIILIGLIALVLFGVFLTIRYVPKITTGISNASKSFVSVFASKKTTSPTATSTPTKTIPTKAIAATSTSQTIAVIPTTNPATATSTATPTASSAVTSQPKTPAKLVSNILSTNTFGGRTTVVFNIQNVGGTTSGSWSFNATLPSIMTPKYYSVTQTPLAPLSGVIYTLGFTADQYAGVPIQITIFQ